jgi:Rrf2 family cysteine metabolism transcriptional repressor
MQLSSYGAYGLWITRVLAASDKPVRRPELEQRLGIDEGFIQQVMIRLAKAGIVRSERGYYGGYRLAKDAGEITLRMVLEAEAGRPLFHADAEDPPLLATARKRVRELVAPVLDMSILEWKLPPKLPPRDVS